MRFLYQFLKSSYRFFARWLYLWVSVTVLLIFHSTNLYSTVLRPQLPMSWLGAADQVMKIVNQWSFEAAIVIAIFTMLYTYSELDRELHRDINITRKLKEFYSEFGDLARRDISSDRDVEVLKIDSQNLRNSVKSWVKKNMAVATYNRLTQQEASGFQHFTFKRDMEFSDEHGKLIDDLCKAQERILVLIENDTWQ